jgi:hypothetical protein
MAHSHRALAGLAHEPKGLVDQIVERFAVPGTLAQKIRGLAEPAIGLVLELLLEGVDPGDALLVALNFLASPMRSARSRKDMKLG